MIESFINISSCGTETTNTRPVEKSSNDVHITVLLYRERLNFVLIINAQEMTIRLLQILSIFFSILFSQPSSAQFVDRHIPASTFATVYPMQVVSDDFNGDGIDDIITASAGDDKISYFQNDGVSGFLDLIPISVNVVDSVSMIALSDLTNNGNNDVIGASAKSGDIIWIENLGNGSFGSEQFIASGWNGINYIQSADVDNDNDNDILFSISTTGSIYLIENIGMGGFSTPILITSTITGISQFHIADIDGDLDMDIFTASSTVSEVQFIENSGLGNFLNPLNIVTGSSNTIEITSADLDQDGDLDLIHHFGSSIQWVENLGSNIFGSSQATGGIGGLVITEDVNQDGNIDIVVNAYGTFQGTKWLENNGGGTFSAPAEVLNGIVSSGSSSITFGDVDNDGVRDIIYTTTTLIGISTQDRVAWARNLAQVPSLDDFDYYQSISSGGSLVINLLVQDIDNDNDLDIISSNGGDIRVQLNQGNGLFNTEIVLDVTDGLVEHHRIGDLNNDGLPDILTMADGFSSAPDSIGWFENFGNGLFSTFNFISDQFGAADLDITDVDNDGDMDFISSGQGAIYWHENNGTGTFLNHYLIDSTNAYHPLLTDLDNDGYLDVSVLRGDSSLIRYKNLGNGTFDAPTFYTIPANWFSNGYLLSGDIDNDGDQDLVQYNGQSVYFVENLGGWNLSPPVTIIDQLSADNPFIDLADIDFDGDLDLFITSEWQGEILWIPNFGNGTFGNEVLIYLPSLEWQPKSIKTGDCDNDGDIDVFVASNRGITWYESNGALLTQVNGTLYYDLNNNGNLDNGEPGMEQLSVTSSPFGGLGFSNTSGNYFLNLTDSSAVYDITPIVPQEWSISSNPQIYSTGIGSGVNLMTGLDFGFYPDTVYEYIEPNLVGGFPRCNDTINYWLEYSNLGTVVNSGVIELKLDDSLNYISSINPPDSIVGNSIYWHFDSLVPFQSDFFSVAVGMPNFMSIGDTLNSVLTITDSISFTDTLAQVLLCGYDPNDKLVSPTGIDAPGYIASTTPFLEYTIRFQNTGNDTVFTVVIEDLLDNNLDWSSMHILGSSHPVDVSIQLDGLVKFKFSNIFLPDSNVNFLGSQGFVNYRIDLIPGLPYGSTIENTAEIYFDLNPPIVTNTTLNTIDISGGNGIEEEQNELSSSIHIYPNPFQNQFTIKLDMEISDLNVVLYDLQGRRVSTFEIKGKQSVLDIQSLRSGTYNLVIESMEGQVLAIKRLIKQK